jgi:ketosteroid isomerase-like protein
VNEALRGLAGALHDSFARHGLDGEERARRNLGCLGALYDAVGRGDFDAAYGLIDADAEYCIFAAGPIPFQMSGRGSFEVQQGLRHNFSAVSFDAVSIDTLAAQGDVVVLIARQRGRWLESGVAFDERVVLEYRFRDAKILRYRGWILPEAP